MATKKSKKAHKSQSKKEKFTLEVKVETGLKSNCEFEDFAFFIDCNGSNKFINCKNDAEMKRLMEDEDVIFSVVFEDEDGNDCRFDFKHQDTEKNWICRRLCGFSTHDDECVFGEDAVRFVSDRHGSSLYCVYYIEEKTIVFLIADECCDELIDDENVLQCYANMVA